MAKAITGNKGQETQVRQVEEARENLGFVDYMKSKSTIISGDFIAYGELAGDAKIRHWRVRNAKTKQTVLYFGMRKDGKGVYCRSSIPQLCTEFKKQEVVKV